MNDYVMNNFLSLLLKVSLLVCTLLMQQIVCEDNNVPPVATFYFNPVFLTNTLRRTGVYRNRTILSEKEIKFIQFGKNSNIHYDVKIGNFIIFKISFASINIKCVTLIKKIQAIFDIAYEVNPFPKILDERLKNEMMTRAPILLINKILRNSSDESNLIFFVKKFTERLIYFYNIILHLFFDRATNYVLTFGLNNREKMKLVYNRKSVSLMVKTAFQWFYNSLLCECFIDTRNIDNLDDINLENLDQTIKMNIYSIIKEPHINFEFLINKMLLYFILKFDGEKFEYYSKSVLLFWNYPVDTLNEYEYECAGHFLSLLETYVRKNRSNEKSLMLQEMFKITF